MPDHLTRRSLLIGGAAAGIGLTIGVAEAEAASRGVAYRYQQQPNGWYCSAASARIALSTTLLRRGDAIPSQNSLAKSLNLHPYDGPSRENMGLKEPDLIAKVLNRRLGYTGLSYRYRFRIAPSGTLYRDLQAKVRSSINAGHPVVINMNQVDSNRYAGHYIAIVGYSDRQYKIADPANSNRAGVWRDKQKIVDWNKLNRFTYFGYAG
ncbi:C39 family peptidase [Microlunatus sp. GCM10028923]|uniref:C39 family peptidase n=1 Tax=Microlunatus sp. GCM10028923 TaxID=3273400 RepID=UPI00360B4EFE